ncbi:hypothetical protein VZC37_15735 [Gordonia sp. LSe1-13]|uniref:Uncharacterized protein n=1 Tax=Gordonia sesuvii TaxID=3116777 RepID=A0ABU7MF99_9ACTN|nr:hypothetical protein [Gordonia sp. LSe1-13]
MSLPIVNIRYLGEIHSPFTGLPAELNESPNESDTTLLFVYYGDVSEWAYVNSRLAKALPADPDDLDLDDIQEGLDIEAGILIAVDTDWNGVNFYGFAPAESEIHFASEE